MAVVINTNVDSLKIQNLLNGATTRLSEAMQRMSSGNKILSAKDDAAGTVISARMKVQLNGNKIAQNNVQNASALLATAEGNLDVIEDNISRIRDLTLQAKNGTYSKEEIQAMQDEVAERMAEIDRINASATHSSLRLFGDNDGTAAKNPVGLAKSGATFQVGPNDGVDNTILADSLLFKSVEFSAMTGAKNFNLVTIYEKQSGITSTAPQVDYDIPASAMPGTEKAEEKKPNESEYDQAIRALDLAIDNITNRRSIVGSTGNRMDSAFNTLTTQYENLSSAKSIITDTDVAQEASKYTQESILQQVSTSLLAQANQAPSIALSLV